LDIDAEIRGARIRSVSDRIVGTSFATVFNAALMTGVLEATAPSKGPWLWFALVITLAAVRLALWRAYHRQAPGSTRFRVWEVIAIGGAALSGALWGGGAVLMFPADESSQMLWLFIIAGMCAGAAALHAAHLPTAFAFIGPAAVPLVVLLAIQPAIQRIAEAAMLLAFVATLIFTVRHFSSHFDRTLRLQFELDSINRRLRQEIEQHRSTEESLRQAQKMEAVGQLTGGIAHDFNNLLTVITGSLDLILRQAGGQEAITRLATAAKRAASRGARLTGSLLSFARKQSLTPEPVDINWLVGEFAPLLRRAAGATVQLELNLVSDESTTNTDTAHCQSALLNLVINARDAMPNGGQLVISTHIVTLTTADLTANLDARPGEFVAISVCDTGTGMPSEVVAKAFEPFFTTKEIGKGSGLGLSQIYGFVRQSGGHVTIDSRLGEGTTVSLLLPRFVSPVSAVSPQPTLVPKAEPSTIRVLLVEDDAEVRDTLQEALTLDEWDVTTAPNGEAAVTTLQRDPHFGILVTDIAMGPGMSGVDLAHAAVAACPNLSVLLISGYPQGTVITHGAIGRSFEVLQKPFTSAQLTARMQVAVAMGKHITMSQ
jgi:signal transduction histidine kinase/CheY-like chemotaxis protein